MRHSIAPSILLALAGPAAAVDPADLKPGLVASYPIPAGQPVSRVVPSVGLTLGKGESPVPGVGRLGQIGWRGYVNVLRAGEYAFTATAEGGAVRVVVDDATVYDPRIPNLAASCFLKAGVLPILVSFDPTAVDDRAKRIEVFWEGPGFVREPLPPQFLGHLPADRGKAFVDGLAYDHGRFLVEEHGCANCHTSADKSLVPRFGPVLTDVAKRTNAGWIDAWLADPQKLQPHAVMPKLFADDAQGRTERYAVTKYLVSLGGTSLDQIKVPLPPNDFRQSMDRGRTLFHTVGCAACHNPPLAKRAKDEEDEKLPLEPADYLYGLGTKAGPAAKYDLGAIGSQTRAEPLAAFLKNPLKVHPSGRMPSMNLDDKDALDIARYVCRTVDDSIPIALAPDPSKSDKDWAALGRQVVTAKGCVNCHAIEENGKPLPPTVFAAKAGPVQQGCLAPVPTGAAPVYKLDEKEKADISAFMKAGPAVAPSPTYAVRTTLRRFSCLNCHVRDGEGGIPLELADQIRLMEKAENADDVRPPQLTGVGHKARTSWLKKVLTESGRARPWMQLRMPQYGEPHVGFLAEAFALAEGTTPDDTITAFPITADKIEQGKLLIGKNGHGCISCHDISGIPNVGTRGPDLATTNQRVRYDWYGRWMHQPLRMAPGTRMPQIFQDGKSLLTGVYGGAADPQAEAMWAYLALGPGLPLPAGMEPPKGLIVAVGARPELLRTFLPDAGNRAVAVGYPGGLNVAFGADQCRLAYAWAGNFLDVRPVWDGRGGQPAKTLGPKVWTAPPGHPWGLTAGPNPPDFASRAANPAYGTPYPADPPRAYTDPQAVEFRGYALDADGVPTFRYRLSDGPTAARLDVAETPRPLKATFASGVRREFVAELPANYTTWFLAGTTAKEPRLIGAKPPDWASAAPAASADRVTVVLPSDGDRAVVLRVSNPPAGAEWRFVRQPKGGWHALLMLPAAKEAYAVPFAVDVWGVPKDDDALIRGLENK